MVVRWETKVMMAFSDWANIVHTYKVGTCFECSGW